MFFGLRSFVGLKDRKVLQRRKLKRLSKTIHNSNTVSVDDTHEELI
jgi:hypothetical protein